MPRNKSEKAPQYSPAVTAWFVASHKVRALEENSYDECDEEDKLFYEMTSDDQKIWGDLDWDELDPLPKQVYDAAQSK